MKLSQVSKLLVLGLAVLLAASAFAESKGALQLSDKVMVNGQPLAAGQYSVRWNGDGPKVELSIVKNNKVVATVPARFVTLPEAPINNSAVLSQGADGNKVLTQVRFGGKRQALAIGEESASMGTSSGTSN